MRHKVITLVFACFTLQAYAQTFAPVGSKWVYCYAANAVGGAEGYDTLVVESVAETHFDTLPCRELRVTYCYSWGDFGCGLVSKVTVCQDDKKVYYQEGDSLYLLYNFGLMPGDTLRIRYPMTLDTFNQLAVDSGFYANPSSPYFDIAILDTAALDLNGQAVWSQTFIEVGSDGPFQPSWYSGQFLGGIGSTAGWLFPRAINALQEEHIPMNLISYTSPVLSGNFLNLNPFCQTTSLEESTPVLTVKVWPNPAKTELNLEVPINGKEVQVQIFDVSGKMLLTATNRAFDTMQVNITVLKPGIYLFKAIMPTRGIAAGRFIVE
ncbi:MAG: T9SS type A sorting domain-containing protein [Saprospiraceae bacterium]|nr:T9SS type A sorting domain-containing protein [Saprospiraceae bacterium]